MIIPIEDIRDNTINDKETSKFKVNLTRDWMNFKNDRFVELLFQVRGYQNV